MAGNPRKFSEKIAIHQRKLNEEKNAFASIMTEVASLTRDPIGVGGAHSSQWGPGTSAGGNFFIPPGGLATNEGISGQRVHMGQTRGRSPGAGAGHGHGHHSHTYHPYRNVSPHHVSPTGPAGHSPERPQLTPPYPGAHMFLVPPQDTSWRRTHSDPGIHASVMQPTIPGVQLTAATQSSPQNCGSPNSGGMGDSTQATAGYYLEPKLTPPQYRPRSCDNVPSISVHPSEPVAGPQVPISSNTGSLPDLPSTILPTQAHLQQLEGVLNSQASMYTQMAGMSPGISGGPIGAGAGAGQVNLQQRHSIQLPVQYTQGVFVNAGNGGPGYPMYGVAGASQSYANTPPFYHQPESPRSGPTSPNDGSEDSPASPQNQIHSPGSPYYALQAKMQNVNIDSRETDPVRQNSPYGMVSGHNVNSIYQQPMAPLTPEQLARLQDEYQQQMYQALIMRQQGHHQHPSAQAGRSEQGHHPPLGPQTSGPIPDIIFTGADGSTSSAGVIPSLNSIGSYIDPTMEMLSSDLRVSLDPVDLENLHGLNSEQGLNIDAASEDALRHDRS